MSSKYGHPVDVRDEAKEEARQVLIEQAKKRQTICYSQLVDGVQTLRLEPNSYALAHMLGDLSSEEDPSGRGMLTVIVVHKQGDMQPGPGFLALANELGRDTADVMRCWIDELNRVWDYWAMQGP